MLPTSQIRAAISDNSVNEEARTVDLVWTTGSKGLRSGWEGSYYEELSLDPSHVDMSRLQSGAPLLDAHDSYSNDSVIGVVERASVDGKQGTATVRFAKDPKSDAIFQKVKDKILRNVSVGYSVQEYTEVSKEEEKIPTYRATNWRPMEISIVPIGFDAGAQVRNETLTQNEVEIITRSINNSEGVHMNEEEVKAKALADAAKAESLKQEAILAERTRSTEIRKAVKDAGLEVSLAEDLIERGLAIDEAKKSIEFCKRAIETSKKTDVVSTTVRVDVGQNDQDKKLKGFQDAMLNRMDSKNFEVTEDAKQFVGKGLLRQVELFIPRHAMEGDVQFSKRAMSSSDLPLALANVAEKGLQKQYELQPRSFSAWTRSDSLRNYKEHSQVKSGDYASLILRPEGTEFQEGSFSEANEVVQMKDYGIIHAFTSQMLLNDDLSVLSRMASSGGIAVSRLENRLAYLALSTNKTMKDGVALYHATHGNLGSTLAINATSVAEAYKLMRKQASTGGLDKLNLVPKFFVCGPDKESEALQFFSPVNAQQTSNVNIYSGKMQVIVDAELTGNQYYFLADPNLIDTVVCYRLEGHSGPQIESRIQWETNSLQLKVAHAFVAEPMDWRGIVKNVGA